MRGVLPGEELARAYSDLFVFQSRTDTFGNVVVEALSSGVPAMLTNEGGPRHIVQHGQSGFVAESDREFTAYVLYALENRNGLGQMSKAARAYATKQDWDSVFQDVFAVYGKCLQESSGRVSQPQIGRASNALRRRAV
jgi:glycosyltransferase involved in cell wall biosynthesis